MKKKTRFQLSLQTDDVLQSSVVVVICIFTLSQNGCFMSSEFMSIFSLTFHIVAYFFTILKFQRNSKIDFERKKIQQSNPRGGTGCGEGVLYTLLSLCVTQLTVVINKCKVYLENIFGYF